MKNQIVSLFIFAAAATLAQAQAKPPSEQQSAAKPIILEKNEGELRTRRTRVDGSSIPTSQFMLKISPKNNGSQHFVLGTEDIEPGGLIPKHRHLEQDEILLIHSGVAHVWLGDDERDAHAGGVVFIPAKTWISLKSIGTEPLSLTFIFSAPGFEDMMRCTSVGAGEKMIGLTKEERAECAHAGHAEYEGLK
jgi:quercetin dioxygenase-like cupin family protein